MRKIKSLKIILIKPSKYDDDGFVVRYFKGVLPSNTLACMRSLTLKFKEKWEMEKNIQISIVLLDDIIDTIPYKKIARRNKGNNLIVAVLVGVQTNQFPRASDIAKKLTALGVKTIIGGFHVSGVLALFDKPSPEIQELIDCGVTLVQGEAESVWEQILSDIVDGKGKTLYRITKFPDISNEIVPQMDPDYLKNFAFQHKATIDCSRGCPFNCSFCTIINVQGHKMRCRSAESVLKTIRENIKSDIYEYFFTDDNFSRNPAWEGIFDGLIRMKEVESLNIRFMMQVDTACHKIPNFIQKASRAGCSQVFIGVESINPKNIEASGKKHNKVDDYADFIKAWHDVGVMTHAGYIIGFPYDTPESVREDINKLINEIKVCQSSFFILTPLPGSMNHYNLVQKKANIDPDLNKFDSFHVVMEHPLMNSEEWFTTFKEAWESFYNFENLKNILMRAGSKAYWDIFKNIFWYKNSLLEPQHPMIAGFVRKKNRSDIRLGTKKMGVFAYKIMRIRDSVIGLKKRAALFFELQELWYLTRKPDDPKFKFVADFSSALTEAKFNLSSIDFNDSYSKWCDDVNTIISTLKAKISKFYNTSELKGKTQKRFNALIDDMNTYLDKIHVPELYSCGIAYFTQYLNTNIRLVEEFSLKQVAKRRKINNFWVITWQRIKKGKIFRFTFSIPRIVISAIRDFRMSLSFAYHLKNKDF
ncbi:B12-binding domain-containing radical SAM protein [Candidatus Latescibacterota bacterium]